MEAVYYKKFAMLVAHAWTAVKLKQHRSDYNGPEDSLCASAQTPNNLARIRTLNQHALQQVPHALLHARAKERAVEPSQTAMCQCGVGHAVHARARVTKPHCFGACGRHCRHGLHDR
eukprot:6199229-Pleurochrysis_carterae.AAC.3